jgi:hypothetical protein
MRRSYVIAIVAVALLASCLLFIQMLYWAPTWKKIVDRCADYNPQWLGMLDCYGVISVWQPDNSGYLIQNNSKSGSIIAQIKSADDFIVRSNEMYLIDITPKGVCNNLVPGKYCGSFQINGNERTYYYDSPDQVPTYVIIDTKTGDERVYANLADAPQIDRVVFQSLLTR